MSLEEEQILNCFGLTKWVKQDFIHVIHKLEDLLPNEIRCPDPSSVCVNSSIKNGHLFDVSYKAFLLLFLFPLDPKELLNIIWQWVSYTTALAAIHLSWSSTQQITHTI